MRWANAQQTEDRYIWVVCLLVLLAFSSPSVVWVSHPRPLKDISTSERMSLNVLTLASVFWLADNMREQPSKATKQRSNDLGCHFMQGHTHS
jgi:nicotinamide riboside kinase